MLYFVWTKSNRRALEWINPSASQKYHRRAPILGRSKPRIGVGWRAFRRAGREEVVAPEDGRFPSGRHNMVVLSRCARL